jgi:hypothetical protein
MTTAERNSEDARAVPAVGIPLDRRVRPALSDVGAAALEAEAARKTRAEARTALRKVRLQWMEETDTWYEKEECRGVEGADEMEAALAAREQAQKAYRTAYSRLRHVIRRYWDRPNVELSRRTRSARTSSYSAACEAGPCSHAECKDA